MEGLTSLSVSGSKHLVLIRRAYDFLVRLLALSDVFSQ